MSLAVPSDDEVKKLCEPLTATTDALKLKEIEARFPGATTRLSIPTGQGVVKYVYEDFYADHEINHMISCDFAEHPYHTFVELGSSTRPTLIAEWRGIYIDLSQLF